MLSKQVVANAFNTSGGNALNTSGAYNEFPSWGRRPKAIGPIWGGAAGGRTNYMLR